MFYLYLLSGEKKCLHLLKITNLFTANLAGAQNVSKASFGIPPSVCSTRPSANSLGTELEEWTIGRHYSIFQNDVHEEPQNHNKTFAGRQNRG